MFNNIPSGYALIAAIFLLTDLPSVRLSDHDCQTNLQSLCQGVNSVKSFLDNPFDSFNENFEVRCAVRRNNPLTGWSLSPDGTELEESMINTSLAKYTVSENRLRINEVNASDEGLYRCVYAYARDRRLCIKVYARAVFASCPSSYGGCSEPENISVTAGEDIRFNASIIHMLGGNCGFKQSIDTVELRIQNYSNIDYTSWSTITGNDRISATMSPDTERCFILSHSTIEDSGVYQVVVTGIEPQNGAQSTSITKTYRVTVQEPTTTTIATTDHEERETTVANGTSFSTATTDASQSTKPTTTDSALHCSSAKPILCATLAVSVTILAIILLIIILVLLFKLKICTLRKLKDNTLLLSRDDNVGQEASTRIQIDGENITFTHDVAVTASSQTLNENDSAHHSDNTAPHLCGNQQENFDSNASSSSGTSTPAPEHQSNDDQDILSVLQDSNASSSSGTSTPASEHQSNNDQDILSATESRRTENSPEDVGEQCGPSEIQRAKREGLKRLDLSSRPALPDLMNHVASKTPTKWMVLGIQLGLEAAQLQALDHQHRGRSDSIFADIFDYWGKSSGLKPVTWSTMIEALKSQSVGEMALAHHLESTVLSTCSNINNNMDDGWQQSQE